MKSILKNRKANYNYHILKTYETGIVLKGGEVKSIRQGKISLNNSYGRIIESEIYLMDMHISPYNKSLEKINPKRPRKLLMHKKEIRKIEKQLQNKGLTLIPIEIYTDRGLIKVLLGLAKGKKEYEKRERIIEKEQKRQIRKNL